MFIAAVYVIAPARKAAGLYNRESMELHVLKQKSGSVSPDAMIRSIKRAQAIIARPMSLETQLDGATAYTSPKYSAIAIANGVMDVRIVEGGSAGAVVDAIDARFAEAGTTCLRFECNEMNWPADIASLLKQRECRAIRQGVYQLLQYQPATASPAVQVIPGRAAYAQVGKLFRAIAMERSHSEVAADQWADAIIDQLDDSRIDLFLARKERVVVGGASVLTLGNVGVILDWAALAGDASEEVWQTLSARVIDHCQRAQFEQVLISLDEGDARIARFVAMGFVLAASYERYERSGR